MKETNYRLRDDSILISDCNAKNKYCTCAFYYTRHGNAKQNQNNYKIKTFK